MTQLLLDQARAFHKTGRLDDAERLYGQVLTVNPKNYDAHYLLASLLNQKGRAADAFRSVQTALTLKPNAPEALALHAAAALAANRPDDALASATKITRLSPRDANAWFNLGVVLTEMRRFEQAVSAFDKANAIRPHVAIWTNRGAALQELGRHDEALKSFDAALALQPGLIQALYNRANALIALGRFVEALSTLDMVVSQHPANAEAWNNRGICLFELERFADALLSYERALALKPDHAATWANRGRAFQRTRHYADALASYERALVLRPDHATDLFHRAEVLRDLGRFDEAIAGFDRCIDLVPNPVNTWSARAMTLKIMSRFEEALADVDRALAIMPTHAQSLLLRGWLLCEFNRISEGFAVIRQSADAERDQKPPQTSREPHKQRHDAEQRGHLSQKGVSLADGAIHIAAGERLAGSAINNLNTADATKQWRTTRPQIVVLDNFLTEDALAGLRAFCWDSTLWNKVYSDGYLGALPEHGFACPLLAQVAEELRDTFTDIVGDNRLQMTWGFKYDSTLRGIRLHADQAAVNVNFWITPDEANLAPDSGGLVIWDVKPPQDWDFGRYNGDEPASRKFLADADAKPVKVPYRSNRAVIFDSDLFHETDDIHFKDGYRNRRINITMLYGRRNVHG